MIIHTLHIHTPWFYDPRPVVVLRMTLSVKSAYKALGLIPSTARSEPSLVYMQRNRSMLWTISTMTSVGQLLWLSFLNTSLATGQELNAAFHFSNSTMSSRHYCHLYLQNSK